MKFVKLMGQSRSLYWLLLVIFIVFPQNTQSSCSHYYTNACRSIQGKLGTCVPLAACPLFSGWLRQRPLVKQNLRLLVRYTCFFDIENPKVCCPNDNLFSQDDFVNFRIGSTSRRALDSKPANHNKLVFPSPSLAFPSSNEEGTHKKSILDATVSNDEDEVSENPHGRHFVPLTFPNEGIPPPSSVSSVGRGKSVWNGMKNSKPVEATRKDLRTHQNFRLIPKLQDCSNAVKLDSLILGPYGAYPWIALIGMKRRNSLDFEHVCAGAIINNRYILSSSHCFDSSKPRYVRLGEYDLNSLIDEGSEYLPQSRREDYRIEKFTIHPDYNPTRRTNDIALIRTEKQLALNTTFMRPACLPFLKEYGIENRLDLNNLDGKSFWVAGWSRHSRGGYSSGSDSSILQESIVEYTSHEHCRQDYPQISAFSSRAQVCIGGKGRRNSCVPDSGGPLMLPLKVPGRVEGFMEPKYFMLGLLSKGPTGKMCQNSDSYSLPTSVYTKISKYLTWILDNIQE